MTAFRKYLKFQLLFVAIAPLFIVSCLKDETEEYQIEHDQKMEDLKIQYGFTESDLIGDNIYLKILEEEGSDTSTPTLNDLVIIDYIGSVFDGSIVDVSVSEVAVENDIYSDEYIYGPEKLLVGYTFLGFQKAIQHMHPKSRALMLIPREQWNTYYYEPLVYEVTLYRIINSLDEYNNEQVSAYLDSLEIANTDHVIPGYEDGGIWIKGISNWEENGLSYGDSVLISLHGYYVEADASYMKDFPGRKFFPIGSSGDSVPFVYGEDFFPITPAVNEAIKFMQIGETIDLVTLDEYGFGEIGFKHPNFDYYIIPPYMPLHYTLQLLDTVHLQN